MPSRKAAGPLWQQAMIEGRMKALEDRLKKLEKQISEFFKTPRDDKDELRGGTCSGPHGNQRLSKSAEAELAVEYLNLKGKLAEDAVHRSRLGRAGPISHIPERRG